MAALFDCHLGDYHHVSRFHAELRRVCGGACAARRGRGWFATGHGTWKITWRAWALVKTELMAVGRSSTYPLFIGVAIWRCALVCFIPLHPYREPLVVSQDSDMTKMTADNLGLLARGLAEIGPRGGQEGWRWILIIEGIFVSVDSAVPIYLGQS